MASSIQYRMPGRSDKSPSRFRTGAVWLAAFALVDFSALARAGGAATIQFNIPAQPLSSGVIEFSRQANVQILTAGSRLQGVNTPGVSGSFSVTAGIAHLLAGTGFGYHLVGSDTISLIPPPGRKVSLDGPARAQIEPAAPIDEDAIASSRRDGETTGDNKASKAPALQEIIVTAQKYSQRAFDVPMSLQVISGAEVQQYGITDLSNLQYDVPGLYMNSTGYTHSVFMRGVGSTVGNAAMVGEYLDEADITAEGINGAQGYATGDNGLYDLNRVEVLKGPQGTLYGDGSMGGVIRYITNKPDLDQFEMSSDVAAQFTEYGAPSQRIEAMLNTPVVPGAFGLRFAGMLEHDGGWVDEPAADLKNINDDNLIDVRTEASWQPIESLKVNATQIIHRDASGLGMGENDSGNITPLFNTTLVPHSADSSDLSNLTITYDFSGAQLLSSSTYTNEEQNVQNLYITESLGPDTYWLLYPQFASSDADYSEEVRLVHSKGGPWQWTVGGFYKDFRYQYFDDYYFGSSGSTLTDSFHSTVPTDRGLSDSVAGFANVSYNLLARVTMGAGVRYSKDRESLVSKVFPFSAATFTSTDPRFDLRYRVTQDVNTYISASKGFRSGGFNLAPAPPYQPESLWSYELGTKIRSPESGLAANVSLFQENFSNFVQASQIPPHSAENIGKARIEGIDADLTWQLGERWRLGANVEALESEFLSATAISGFKVGNRLPYAPKYSFTASVQRGFSWRHRPGDAEIYYYEISRVQVRAAGLPVQQSDIMHFLNARVSIDWTDGLSFGVFAHNLLNDRGLESPDAFLGESIRPQPRTLGVQFDLKVQ